MQANGVGKLIMVTVSSLFATTLPESDEKRELVDRLDRMKDEVHKLVQSWGGQAKAVWGMERGGHWAGVAWSIMFKVVANQERRKYPG